MQDRLHQSDPPGFLSVVIMLASLGAMIGLGHLLSSPEVITIRKAVGRAVVSGGLALIGGLMLLVPMKGLPQAWYLIVAIAAGAALASLGTSGIERLFSLAAPHIKDKLKRWSRK